MRLNLIGPFITNAPYGTEIAFGKGLRRIGVDTIEVDPNIDRTLEGMDQGADATIVFKSCVGAEAHLKRLKGPVIVYMPDDARFHHIRGMMVEMRRYSDLLLSFDDHGADVARTMGYRAAETLLLTADDELYSPSPEPVERDIDISFIGSLGDGIAHASRRRMIEVVQGQAEVRGWVTSFGSTNDIPRIIETYRRSKVVLNHATDVGQHFGFGFGLQCRHFEVGMTRTCLLTNNIPVEQPQLDVPTFGNERDLIDKITLLLTNGTYEWAGEQLYAEVLAGHMPQHRAQQLVDFIGRNA